MLLWLLSWLAYAFYAVSFTLCFAVGLYYLAELVEEYTVAAGRAIRWLLLLTLGLHAAALATEDVWWSLLLVGVAAHVVYAGLLKTYPVFQFASPSFLLSALLLLAHHYLTFAFFAETQHTFLEVLAFFTFFVWPTPFMLVISLSANEMVLPQTAEPAASPLLGLANPVGGQRQRQQQQPVLYSDSGSHFVHSYLKGKRRGLLYFCNNLRDWLSPAAWKAKKGY